MKKSLSFLIASIILVMFASVKLFAGPPAAPAGWKWQVVSALTDEFDGNVVNTTKWFKTNPYWGGRDPGRFKEYCVTQSGGYLRLKNYYLPPTSQQVWVNTGFLASRNKLAIYVGYYCEASIKGAKDGSVYGFWMSKPGSTQEIDVCEGVAYSGLEKWRYLGNYMRMNTHTPSNKVTPRDHNAGWNLGDGFHTFGVYWKGARHIVMYYGGSGGTAYNHYPVEDFTGGMQLNLNNECQNWLGNPIPSRLTNNSYNTTYVAYIHTWALVKIKAGETNSIEVSNELKVFPNPASDVLKITGIQYGNYEASIYDVQGKLVGQKVIDANSDNTTIGINDLVKGIYILNLRNDEVSKTIRFVKE